RGLSIFSIFFILQAEDSIRDFHVTGVQTCALPIYAARLKTTVDGLVKSISPDGRIHTTLNQTITATGRLSSTDPNLQNIPIRTEIGRASCRDREQIAVCAATVQRTTRKIQKHTMNT